MVLNYRINKKKDRNYVHINIYDKVENLRKAFKYNKLTSNISNIPILFIYYLDYKCIYSAVYILSIISLKIIR